jgi:hypothetical protein
MKPVLPTTLTFTVTGSNEEEIVARIWERLEGYVGSDDPVYSSIEAEVVERDVMRTNSGETVAVEWRADVRVVLP